MTRRGFLHGLAWLSLGGAAASRGAMAQQGAALTAQTVEEMRKNWRKLLAKGADVAESAAPLKLSKEEWKKRLSSEQFNILREEGTERAGTSALNGEKRAGVFVCAGCALPLFTSEMKYESGTGWPSFFTSIPAAFGTSKDYKLILPRTEYHCARCGGHHGHLFDDGPAPTRQRWCNNGIALRFIPAA